MTQQELSAAFAQLGLKVPEAACKDIVEVIGFIEDMKLLVRKQRPMIAEPAHIVYC